MEATKFECSRCTVPLGEIRFTNTEASFQIVCVCGASYIASDHGLVFREGVRHPKFVDGEPAHRLQIISGIRKRAGEHSRQMAKLVDACNKEIKELQHIVVDERVMDNRIDAAAENLDIQQLLKHFSQEQLAAILQRKQ